MAAIPRLKLGNVASGGGWALGDIVTRMPPAQDQDQARVFTAPVDVQPVSSSSSASDAEVAPETSAPAPEAGSEDALLAQSPDPAPGPIEPEGELDPSQSVASDDTFVDHGAASAPVKPLISAIPAPAVRSSSPSPPPASEPDEWKPGQVVSSWEVGGVVHAMIVYKKDLYVAAGDAPLTKYTLSGCDLQPAKEIENTNGVRSLAIVKKANTASPARRGAGGGTDVLWCGREAGGIVVVDLWFEKVIASLPPAPHKDSPEAILPVSALMSTPCGSFVWSADAGAVDTPVRVWNPNLRHVINSVRCGPVDELLAVPVVKEVWMGSRTEAFLTVCSDYRGRSVTQLPLSDKMLTMRYHEQTQLVWCATQRVIDVINPKSRARIRTIDIAACNVEFFGETAIIVGQGRALGDPLPNTCYLAVAKVRSQGVLDLDYPRRVLEGPSVVGTRFLADTGLAAVTHKHVAGERHLAVVATRAMEVVGSWGVPAKLARHGTPAVLPSRASPAQRMVTPERGGKVAKRSPERGSGKMAKRSPERSQPALRGSRAKVQGFRPDPDGPESHRGVDQREMVNEMRELMRQLRQQRGVNNDDMVQLCADITALKQEFALDLPDAAQRHIRDHYNTSAARQAATFVQSVGHYLRQKQSQAVSLHYNTSAAVTARSARPTGDLVSTRGLPSYLMAPDPSPEGGVGGPAPEYLSPGGIPHYDALPAEATGAWLRDMAGQLREQDLRHRKQMQAMQQQHRHVLDRVRTLELGWVKAQTLLQAAIEARNSQHGGGADNGAAALFGGSLGMASCTTADELKRSVNMTCAVLQAQLRQAGAFGDAPLSVARSPQERRRSAVRDDVPGTPPLSPPKPPKAGRLAEVPSSSDPLMMADLTALLDAATAFTVRADTDLRTAVALLPDGPGTPQHRGSVQPIPAPQRTAADTSLGLGADDGALCRMLHRAALFGDLCAQEAFVELGLALAGKHGAGTPVATAAAAAVSSLESTGHCLRGTPLPSSPAATGEWCASLTLRRSNGDRPLLLDTAHLPVSLRGLRGFAQWCDVWALCFVAETARSADDVFARLRQRDDLDPDAVWAVVGPVDDQLAQLADTRRVLASLRACFAERGDDGPQSLVWRRPFLAAAVKALPDGCDTAVALEDGAVYDQVVCVAEKLDKVGACAMELCRLVRRALCAQYPQWAGAGEAQEAPTADGAQQTAAKLLDGPGAQLLRDLAVLLVFCHRRHTDWRVRAT